MDHGVGGVRQRRLSRPGSALCRDRTLLTGDAALVVRPHTAAGAKKAAADAIALFTALHRHGVRFGQRLGLGGPEADPPHCTAPPRAGQRGTGRIVRSRPASDAGPVQAEPQVRVSRRPGALDLGAVSHARDAVDQLVAQP